MSGPHDYEEKCLKIQLRNTSILAETKMEIMQCAVAKCSKVCISTHGIQIPSLLDSGSEVTLLQQSYFDQHILPKIKPATGEKANTHCLFKLTVANDGQMPIKLYTELDLSFLGLKVPKVGVLIAEEPNQVLEKKTSNQITWYNRMEFNGCPMTCSYRNMGPQDSTHLYVLKESILCCFPNCAFFTILMYGRPIHWEQHQKSCPRTLKLVSPQRQMTCLKKKDQLYFKRKNGAIGQVTIGSKQNPVCVPGNSALTVPGQTSKIPTKLTCLVEQAQHHNCLLA